MIDNGKVKKNNKIDDIGITNDDLTSRSGLAPIAEFLRKCGVPKALAAINPVKKNNKGISDEEAYEQILLKFIDGTNTSLTGFDKLKKDPSYFSCCGLNHEDSMSSHTVKRFIENMPRNSIENIRRILLSIFKNALIGQQPSEIIIDIDTVVFDNDDALAREGCSPTYKNVKGFQPLLIKWGNIVVWAEFREGKEHSNHGTTVTHALKVIFKLIQSTIKWNIPIIVTMDAGFFDQKIFSYIENAGAFYISSGKLYADIQERMDVLPLSVFKVFNSASNNKSWEYIDAMDKRNSWEVSRRVVYTRQSQISDGQLELIKVESIIYTNTFWDSCKIIETAHGRGKAELVHRKLKDFANEQLPFKKFENNAVWFFLILIAFDLFEMFKLACDSELHTAHMYPTTFRREFIDKASKIVSHAGETIMKTTASFFTQLKALWQVQKKFNYSSIC